jgi:hypothetical protein
MMLTGNRALPVSGRPHRHQLEPSRIFALVVDPRHRRVRLRGQQNVGAPMRIIFRRRRTDRVMTKTKRVTLEFEVRDGRKVFFPALRVVLKKVA